MHEFNLHSEVQRAMINFIHNTYKESEVLLDLKYEDGNINKDPLIIIKNLWTHVPKLEKEQETVKQWRHFEFIYNQICTSKMVLIIGWHKYLYQL